MNSPYPLLPLALLSLLLYLFTFTMSRLGIIKHTTHKKFWNLLLAVTFFITALLGLILAIQVNYKLKIPYLKQLLTWHVDFGIGMTMIAVFHFIWHWNYYVHMFKGKKNSPPLSTYESSEEKELLPKGIVSSHSLVWSAMLLGITTILAQIIFLREFLMIFGGNELIIGIILANWMVITAAGAYLGRLISFKKLKRSFIAVAFVLLGIMPAAGIFLVNFLKNIVFQPGVAFGVLKITFSSAIILAPFCLLSGLLFTYTATVYSAILRDRKTDKIYAFESLGSIMGGLLFSYVLASLFSTFQILAMLFFLNMVSALFIIAVNWKLRLAIGIPSLALMVLPFFVDIDKTAKQFMFQGQEIEFLKDTPYGNLVVTKYGDQQNFYENNMLMFTTENIVANEEAVHYAMIQHNAPRDVLLVSGGISGITNEILKYGVERIDYLELNPWIFRLGYGYTSSLDNPKINLVAEDARLFIGKTDKKYDIILINLPDPVTAQINRYYTIDFYREAKDVLKPGGILSFGLASTANYISDKAIELNSVILSTVKSVFNYVLIFPGEKNYFILSDNPVHHHILSLFEERGIENSYVNRYYLDNELIVQRAEYIMSVMKPDVKLNRDYSPVAYFNQINLWLSRFGVERTFLNVVFLLFVFLLLLIFYKAHPANTGMMTAGYAASTTEMLLIIVFQVIYGYVYLLMGVFFAVFMAGLALGSAYRHRVYPHPEPVILIKLQLIIAGALLLLLPGIALLKYLDGYKSMVFLVCFGLLFAIAFVVGIFFSAATVLQPGSSKYVSAGVYSFDLLGSAAGAFFTTVFLIPLIGFYGTAAFSIALTLIGVLVIYIKTRDRSV